MPLHVEVKKVLQSYEDGQPSSAALAAQPGNTMQHADSQLAVRRLALVLEQVMQDLQRMVNAQLRDGTHRFLSMCEAKT